MTPFGQGRPRATLVRLFLVFSAVYIIDHAITMYGVHRGVVEGNPLARVWFDQDPTLALGMKAVGLGCMALGVVAVPRLWPGKGYQWMVTLLLVASFVFLVVLGWNLTMAVFG